MGTTHWVAIFGCVVALVVALVHHRLGAGNLLLAILVLPLVRVSRWANSNATRVFATSEGLELTDRNRTVPWSSVAEAHQVRFGQMIPLYRVTFSDGTAPLTFFTWEYVEQVIARFKAAPNHG